MWRIALNFYLPLKIQISVSQLAAFRVAMPVRIQNYKVLFKECCDT